MIEEKPEAWNPSFEVIGIHHEVADIVRYSKISNDTHSKSFFLRSHFIFECHFHILSFDKHAFSLAVGNGLKVENPKDVQRLLEQLESAVAWMYQASWVTDCKSSEGSSGDKQRVSNTSAVDISGLQDKDPKVLDAVVSDAAEHLAHLNIQKQLAATNLKGWT